jgi:glycosyltransferase involved in cell wall biosynthesis
MFFLFWLSVALILYVYIGYPLTLLLAGGFMKRPILKGPVEPTVDMIIPAYNEEHVIAAKINNTLALDYPADKIRLIVVSDGSTDRTDAIVESFAEKGVLFFRQPQRMGKAAALNRGVSQAGREIVVFTDASILLTRSALKQIVRPFRDPSIGCVSGEDHIPEGGGEGLYGQYELLIRNLESRSGSIVGASGCFYAQRRELCPNFQQGRAPDFISVLETVRRGFRAITEPAAVGVMGKVAASSDEFKRKVRTIIRGLTALMDYKGLLNPRNYGVFSVALLSHKILRWAVPWLMATALLTNVLLADHLFYAILLALQVGFYTLALIGWFKERGKEPAGIEFRLPLFFCVSNLAALVAVLKYAAGVRQEVWESSKR